jgi:ribosomal protein S12 methylthiotransferase
VRSVHPKVLAVTGPHATREVMEAVHAHLPPAHDPFVDLVPPQGIRLTPDHYAYLKISEGCNHRCTFCIIPSLRGDLVSRPIGEVLREAEVLAAAGVRELLVISQDTSAYGVDVKYRTGFHDGRPVKTRLYELCRELGKLGLWVRLHYVYPYPSVDDLIPLMAEGKILPYLDVPFQHASPRILKLMKRPASAEKVLDRIAAWRREVPDLAIRSTFITGFPGETEAEFNELLDFLDEAQLDRVGAFAYSPVEGATANALPGALPDAVREERKARLLRHQEDISTQRLERLIGRRIQVLVDEIDEDGAIARSRGDAPDVDGLVYIADGRDLEIGEFAEVDVIDCDVHDLHAVIAVTDRERRLFRGVATHRWRVARACRGRRCRAVLHRLARSLHRHRRLRGIAREYRRSRRRGPRLCRGGYRHRSPGRQHRAVRRCDADRRRGGDGADAAEPHP